MTQLVQLCAPPSQFSKSFVFISCYPMVKPSLLVIVSPRLSSGLFQMTMSDLSPATTKNILPSITPWSGHVISLYSLKQTKCPLETQEVLFCCPALHRCDAGASADPVQLDATSSLQQKTKVKGAGFSSLLERYVSHSCSLLQVQRVKTFLGTDLHQSRVVLDEAT